MQKVTLFICLLLSMNLSAKQIYKCKLDGQIIFSNNPCSEGVNETLNITSYKTTASTNKTSLKYNSNIWFEDISGYQAALKESEKYQTPIFIYFQADWCSYCRRLERELLNTYSAEIILSQFIKVKITPDHGAKEKSFFKMLGNTGYPTVMIQNNPQTRPVKLRTTTKQGNQWKVMSIDDFEETLKNTRFDI